MLENLDLVATLVSMENQLHYSVSLLGQLAMQSGFQGDGKEGGVGRGSPLGGIH